MATNTDSSRSSTGFARRSRRIFVAGEQPVEVHTQEEFETELSQILQSDTTTRLIAELLGMIDRREKINRTKKG